MTLPRGIRWFSSTALRRVSILDRAQTLASEIAQRANSVTGFNQIETIKARISLTEKSVESLKQTVQEARTRYSTALKSHSSVQRAINDLLSRKSEWTSQDVEKLSQLYRKDHQTEKTIEETRDQVEAEEHSLEQERANVGKLMMERYREEQIWSDKIRQFSTWGTMILMAVNLCLFVVVQLIIEPWKRRRLVGQFEERLNERMGVPKAPVQDPQDPQDLGRPQGSPRGAQQWKSTLLNLWNTVWTHICFAASSPENFSSSLKAAADRLSQLWVYMRTTPITVHPIDLVVVTLLCFVKVFSW